LRKEEVVQGWRRYMSRRVRGRDVRDERTMKGNTLKEE
jgi:hypothetical protein